MSQKYGDRVMSAVLHLDEATPHIQFLLLPLDERGKLNCKALFGGTRQVLADLQTDYARAVAHLGISRGREHSQARHQEVAEYYAATQQRKAIPELVSEPEISLPEPPGPLARMKDQALKDYAQAAVKEALEQRTEQLAPAWQALSAEVGRLKETQEQLKEENARLSRENSSLSQENAAFKAQAQKMRDLPLGEVLSKMFGASQMKPEEPGQEGRYQLPDGLEIAVSGRQWRWEGLAASQGKGAINLVMSLQSYGQDYYQQAVRELAEVFPESAVAVSLGCHLAETLSQTTSGIIRGPNQPFKPDKNTWGWVREALTNKLKLPTEMVDQLHEAGLLVSDRRRMAILLPANGQGRIKFSLNGDGFALSLGLKDEPVFLPGQDNKVYVVSEPLEALAVKALKPESGVLLLEKNFRREKVKPYLDRQGVFIKPAQTMVEAARIEALSSLSPQVQTVKPERGQSWLECWQLLRAELDKDKPKSHEEVLRELVGRPPQRSPDLGLSR